MKSYKDIPSYIAAAPAGARAKLKEMRTIVKKSVPRGTTESISYGIPTYKFNGNLVHFGGFKDHIGFFPASSGVAAFKKELAIYASSKGTVRFPLEKPLPKELIARIVKLRVKETLSYAKSKGFRLCNRGHFYKGKAPCPVCYQGYKKGKK